MYYRDIVCEPVIITREEYVKRIFDIGLRYQHDYHTSIAAVRLGDTFIKSLEYSYELSHTVTVIAAKILEDYGYRKISMAADDLNNGYVKKYEIEILKSINFSLNYKSFLFLIYQDRNMYNDTFHNICYNICLNKLYDINPFILILGIFLVYRKYR